MPEDMPADPLRDPAAFATVRIQDSMTQLGQRGCFLRFVPARFAPIANMYLSGDLSFASPYHDLRLEMTCSSSGMAFCEASVFTFPTTCLTTELITITCLFAKSTTARHVNDEQKFGEEAISKVADIS